MTLLLPAPVEDHRRDIIKERERGKTLSAILLKGAISGDSEIELGRKRKLTRWLATLLLLLLAKRSYHYRWWLTESET